MSGKYTAALLPTCGLALKNYGVGRWLIPATQPGYGHSWGDSRHHVSELDEAGVTLEPRI